MLSLRKPSDESISRFLAQQAKLELTYAAVGATASIPPSGYNVDHSRSKIGSGKQVYEAAKQALQHWQQFRVGWVQAGPTETPIQQGEVVAIVAKAFGLWWLNACRIVAVEDQAGPVSRFGFAYGTLPDHAGSGEERFLIEWDQSDDSVWYDILAFSRPHHLLPRLGYPFFRRAQSRFRLESTAAMQRAVTSD